MTGQEIIDAGDKRIREAGIFPWPWEENGRHEYAGKIVDATGMVIATVRSDVWGDYRLDNALPLVAAAPELLDAVKRIRAAIEGSPGPLCGELDALIKKASYKGWPTMEEVIEQKEKK